jgi:hypothetical protein
LQPELVHGCANFLVATSSLAIDRPSLRPALPEIFLAVADDHLIAGYVRLGVLAQLAGNLLDILEAHYVLYDNAQLIESEPLISGIGGSNVTAMRLGAGAPSMHLSSSGSDGHRLRGPVVPSGWLW